MSFFRSVAILLVICGSLCMAPLAVAQPRVVNVTSDSEQGWTPSPNLEESALKSANSFLAALDEGDFVHAYDMMSVGQKEIISLAAFIKNETSFREEAGPLVVRKINRVTWTKDSPTAPQQGIYVAIDIVAKYRNVDHFCGYLILHRFEGAEGFQVSRIEKNFISKSVASTLESKDELRPLWKALSANCPNYEPLELEEAEHSTIGYSSVAEALAALQSNPDVEFRQENGWTIAYDKASRTIWSFSPPDYPAYPAVVQRQIVPRDAGSALNMNVHCEASKAACDDLVRDFTRLNQSILRR